jgi:hypothetical protein
VRDSLPPVLRRVRRNLKGRLRQTGIDGGCGLWAGPQALIAEYGTDAATEGADVVGQGTDGVVLQEKGGRACRSGGPQRAAGLKGGDDGGERRRRVSGRGSWLGKGDKGEQ